MKIAKKYGNNGRMLYFAYGSNMHKHTMRRRCPGARPVGSKLLKDAKLVFRGVADLVYEPGAQTPIAVWEISANDERNLDRHEGVAAGTYDKYYIKVDKHRKALIYLMRDRGIYPPSAFYAKLIRMGYQNWGLDESYLDAAIKHAFTDKEPSEQTQARRQRQRASDFQRQLVRLPEEVALQRLEKQASQYNGKPRPVTLLANNSVVYGD